MDERDGPVGRHRWRPCCELCGEVIGVYEPCMVRSSGGWRTTSLAAEPDLADTEVTCRHCVCGAQAAHPA